MDTIIGHAVDTIRIPTWHKCQLKNKDNDTVVEKWQQLPYTIFSSILEGKETVDPSDAKLVYLGIYDRFTEQYINNVEPKIIIGMYGYLAFNDPIEKNAS